jgi:hypothetical protein
MSVALPFLFATGFSLQITGVPPKLEKKYRLAINRTTKTFTCFDDSATIPMSRFNDNYADCADGSDEPGTADGSAPTFYCPNNGSSPREIPRWAVGDGICDCCDGTDEYLGGVVNCSLTCPVSQAERNRLYKKLKASYRKGLKARPRMALDGENAYADLQVRIDRFNKKLGLLRERIRAVESAPEYTGEEDQPTFRDKILSVWMSTFQISEPFVPYPPGPLTEGERRYRIRQLRESVRETQREIEQLQAFQRYRVEGLPIELYAILEKRFTQGDHSVMIGKDMLGVDSDLLGRYKTYGNESVFYVRGSTCSGKCRSAELKLVCAKANWLAMVTEPTECKHEGIFATPAVCTEERVASLDEMDLPELRNLAAELDWYQPVIPTPEPTERKKWEYSTPRSWKSGEVWTAAPSRSKKKKTKKRKKTRRI